jgi:hypothetical protein
MTIDIAKTFDTRWDRNYAALEQYVNREGNARVTGTHQEDFHGTIVPLGTWVAAQRRRHRSGQLPAGRAGRLEAFAGWEWGPLSPGPGARSERNAEIVALREAGLSLAQIGEQYGLSRQRVHQILARASSNA